MNARRYIQDNSQKLRFATLIIGLTLAPGTSAQICPVNGISIEAIGGSGGNTKVGFICGAGCNKKYYLISNADTYSRCIRQDWNRRDMPCGSVDQYTRFENETADGNNMTIIAVIDPLDCSTTSTYYSTNNSYTRHLQYKRHYSTDCIGSAEFCEAIYLDTPPANPCLNEACDGEALTGYSLVSFTIADNGCGMETSTETWNYVTNDWRSVITIESSTEPGYQKEYTTEMASMFAEACALDRLQDKLLVNDEGIGGRARCSMTVAVDSSSVSKGLGQWRIRIEGAEADKDHRIDLHWLEIIDNIPMLSMETRIMKRSDAMVRYYPGEKGEMLFPKESLQCGYTYSKELIRVTITPQ